MIGSVLFAVSMMTQVSWVNYPRPQLLRDNWYCMNGEWDYQVTKVNATQELPKFYHGKITVPFAFESTLSGAKGKLEADDCLWYHRQFECATAKGKRTYLNFEQVIGSARVYLNEVEVAVLNDGESAPYELDVSDFLVSGNNDIWVCTRNRNGCMASGITGTVWTEQVPETHLRNYWAIADYTTGEVTLKLDIASRAAEISGRAEIWKMGKRLAKASLDDDGHTVRLKLKPAQVKKWTPQTPELYEVRIRIAGDNSDLTDDTIGYFAFRKFDRRIGKTEDGSAYQLNDESLKITGAADYGRWNEGLYTPTSEEALILSIEKIRNAGINVVRKCGKTEMRRYYALCDRMGLMVMQELPCGFDECGISRAVDALGNSPSVVMWIPVKPGYGEGCGYFEKSACGRLVRMDSGRLAEVSSEANAFPSVFDVIPGKDGVKAEKSKEEVK